MAEDKKVTNVDTQVVEPKKNGVSVKESWEKLPKRRRTAIKVAGCALLAGVSFGLGRLSAHLFDGTDDIVADVDGDDVTVETF